MGVASLVGLGFKWIPLHHLWEEPGCRGLGSYSGERVVDAEKDDGERRGPQNVRGVGSLIRSVYKMTKGERAFQRVSRSLVQITLSCDN